jgi:hypothetical protein
MKRGAWALGLAILFANGNGCGGGGGGASEPATAAVRTAIFKASVAWPAGAEAQSVVITLKSGKADGTDLVWTVNRGAETGQRTYPSPVEGVTGTQLVQVVFHPLPGGNGTPLGTLLALVEVDTAGAGMPTVRLGGPVSSFAVPSAQMLGVGKSSPTVANASSGNLLVAMRPGEFDVTVSEGHDVVSISADGVLQGLKAGTAVIEVEAADQPPVVSTVIVTDVPLVWLFLGLTPPPGAPIPERLVHLDIGETVGVDATILGKEDKHVDWSEADNNTSGFPDNTTYSTLGSIQVNAAPYSDPNHPKATIRALRPSRSGWAKYRVAHRPDPRQRVDDRIVVRIPLLGKWAAQNIRVKTARPGIQLRYLEIDKFTKGSFGDYTYAAPFAASGFAVYLKDGVEVRKPFYIHCGHDGNGAIAGLFGGLPWGGVGMNDVDYRQTLDPDDLVAAGFVATGTFPDIAKYDFRKIEAWVYVEGLRADVTFVKDGAIPDPLPDPDPSVPDVFIDLGEGIRDVEDQISFVDKGLASIIASVHKRDTGHTYEGLLRLGALSTQPRTYEIGGSGSSSIAVSYQKVEDGLDREYAGTSGTVVVKAYGTKPNGVEIRITGSLRNSQGQTIEIKDARFLFPDGW